jgi:predicted ATPase
LERDHVRLEAVEKLRRDGAATVTVAPLTDDEMRRLVVNLWPRSVAADATAIGRVCALAEGKPYFAEELVHGAVLEESGLIVDSAPLSIRAGVLTRFEQLSEDAQRVLLYASVIGRTFGAELLTQSTNLSAVQLGDVLAHAPRAIDRRDSRCSRSVCVSARHHSRDTLSRACDGSGANDPRANRRVSGTR